MIGLENYYKLRYGSPEAYDEVWVIMRSIKGLPTGFTHVPTLAPSWDLFKSFLRMKEAGLWNQDTFEEYFAPRYIRDLVKDFTAPSVVKGLLDKARAGKNIALVCTCQHESLCHRSILGGIIQGLAPEVELHAEGDYRRFWDKMKDM